MGRISLWSSWNSQARHPVPVSDRFYFFYITHFFLFFLLWFILSWKDNPQAIPEITRRLQSRTGDIFDIDYFINYLTNQWRMCIHQWMMNCSSTVLFSKGTGESDDLALKRIRRRPRIHYIFTVRCSLYDVPVDWFMSPCVCFKDKKLRAGNRGGDPVGNQHVKIFPPFFRRNCLNVCYDWWWSASIRGYPRVLVWYTIFFQRSCSSSLCLRLGWSKACKDRSDKRKEKVVAR